MGKNDGNEKTCPAKIKWSWELENASPAAILTLKKALKDKWQRIAWKLESAMKGSFMNCSMEDRWSCHHPRRRKRYHQVTLDVESVDTPKIPRGLST